MWKNWFLTIAGLWLIVLGFLGFPSKITRILIIISGVCIAFVAIKTISRHKVEESLKDSEVVPNPALNTEEDRKIHDIR